MADNPDDQRSRTIHAIIQELKNAPDEELDRADREFEAGQQQQPQFHHPHGGYNNAGYAQEQPQYHQQQLRDSLQILGWSSVSCNIIQSHVQKPRIGYSSPLWKKSHSKLLCKYDMIFNRCCNTQKVTLYSSIHGWKERLHLLFVQLVVGVVVMSISVAVNKSPALALTGENILFLQAWKTIDRAYVDKKFNGQSWFRYRETALRNEPMNTHEETCKSFFLFLLDVTYE